MNQYEYVNNNNYQENIFYNNGNEIIEEINQPLSNFIQLEQDIFNLINFLRTNPIEYCNNILPQNKYNQNQTQMEIINYLESIHNKEKLKPYKEIPELSEAARNLLNNIGIHYKNYNNLNMKEMDPSCLNLKTRLSNYGERTGRIFETVLFKMDNPEDIVNHILREEKGRNMLLNHKMKYIGVACDLLSSNLICTVIDIVQEFVPYRNKNKNNSNNNLNNNFNDNLDNNINNDLSNHTYNKINTGDMKKKHFHNKNNSDYISLINNLNNKNSKANLKLNIKMPERKTKGINNNIEMNINSKDNIENNFENRSFLNNKNSYYNTPIKLPQLESIQKEDNIFSPKSEDPNDINIKKLMPKRNNSNNINIIKKDIKNNNNDENENIKNIKFTMAGRTYKQQQEILEISSKKNINKSKSVCSFDVNSNNSKVSNKNKFQRLNHEEKMEILHKINHKKNKTPNSQSVSEKNSENVINLNINSLPPNINNINNDLTQKNINNNNIDINFDIGSKKSPSRSIYNQEYYDINSETDKNNLNNINLYLNNINKNNNINYSDGVNQTYTDLRSNEGMENNDDYSRNKINQIKNDLIYFKNQIKKELKDEVREEIRNEFNKKMLYGNKINRPSIIQLDGDYDFNSKKTSTFYNQRDKRNTLDGNNEINENIYYNKTNNNYYKKKGKNRWSSVQKYYYIKNNNNNINNINNTNIIMPDNDSQYNLYNLHKKRKNLDWRDFINDNHSNDRIQLEEKYGINSMPISNVNSHFSGNNQDNISRGSYKNEFINNNNKINNDNDNESYFNEEYRMKNKQEIKKLIRLYNMAKDDKRNKNITNSNSAYNIINNNKSISNYNFNENQNNNNNIINDNNVNININDEIKKNNSQININNNYKISENLYGNNYEKKNNIVNLKNDFRKKNYFKNNEEEENSSETDFVKGHRFQIKYQKVKPKGQIYKSSIPKPRNISVKKTIIIDNKNYINDNPFMSNVNKTEDFVNLENTNFSNGKEETNNKSNIGHEKDYKIEKTSYIKKYNEITTYNNLQNEKQGINNKKEEMSNNLNSNDKLSITGRFIDDNNNLEDNNNMISNDMSDIKNYMDKNIIYKESKDRPVISKQEKMEGNNIITTITTKTREIYTPDKKKEDNKDLVINKKVHKKQTDLIKEYKKYKKIDNNDYNDYNYNINNSNELRSSDGSKQYINNINNYIQTKNVSLGRKTYDKTKYNKINYIEIDNNSIKTPNLMKKDYYLYENNYYDNSNKSPRYNNNITTKTNSYYKKKKYGPYQNYPYEYTLNYKDIDPPRRINYNNSESLEKKYIKDPEGNLIETYVKKTKYNDGDVLLEYV